MNQKQCVKQLKSVEQIILTAMMEKFPGDFRDEASAWKRLWAELTHYKHLQTRINTLEGLYLQLLKTLVNANMLPKVIKLNQYRADYEKVLFSWDPKKVAETWGKKPDALVKEIFKASHSRAEAPGRICRNFAAGVLEAAQLIGKYSSFEEFREDIARRGADKDFSAGLQYFKENRITGLGPALSLHFFQRLGFPAYAKPDVHVKHVLRSLGWVGEKERDDRVLMQAMYDAYKIAEEPYVPYAIDKLFWIIGSGSLCDVSPSFELGSLKDKLKDL